MSSQQIKRTRLVVTILISVFLVLGTVLAIAFAKGYRPSLTEKTIQGTGLLAASSHPKTASVYINDKLTTSTDDTINLLPDSYHVRIQKDGFIPWQKDLVVHKELVTSTNARLFPSVPSLAAATFTGVSSPTPSPDGSLIAYLVDSNQNQKDGVYVLNTSTNPLGFERAPQQIATPHPQYSLTQAVLLWSPDGKQLLTVFTDTQNQSIVASYLLTTNSLNNFTDLADVTVRLPFIFSEWEQEIAKRDDNLLSQLPDFMFDVATSSAVNIYFSPDGEKMLYTATQNLTIPEQLIPPLPSINSTPQHRDLVSGSTYVYDIKEDTNYLLSTTNTAPQPDTDATSTPPIQKSLLIYPEVSSSSGILPTSSPSSITYDLLQQQKTPLQTIAAFKAHYSPLYTNSPQWYPTSRHLISTQDDKVTIFEYDNTNHASVYSGPFDPSFTYPSPNGSRLFILTNLNQSQDPNNLYTLDLK